ncbi:hypothetical protein B566_EDAN006041 [Ephemera danica]|nr:hypothetical protein B566_EDAN006041 [Ephemera danica]
MQETSSLNYRGLGTKGEDTQTESGVWSSALIAAHLCEEAAAALVFSLPQHLYLLTWPRRSQKGPPPSVPGAVCLLLLCRSMCSLKRALLPTVLLVILISSNIESSTITGDPGSLRVVGSLRAIQESLLPYQPSLESLLEPLSARHLQMFPPMRFYVASPDSIISKQNQQPSNAYLPIPKPFTAKKTPTPTVQTTPKPVSNQNLRTPPSYQGVPINFGFDAEKEDSAVEQIKAYSKPVSIPSSGRAHFSTINVEDGSYHFGYDTGAGQHQSYREERRFPGGRVEGKFGYVDPTGVLRIVEYTADQRGYRSRVTTRNPSFGPAIIGPIPPPLIPKARSAAAAAAAATAAASRKSRR